MNALNSAAGVLTGVVQPRVGGAGMGEGLMSGESGMGVAERRPGYFVL
ncbi:MAG TPA: hypothetical protein VFC47_05215 [Caulobacteraceae bacterium]|nr:hypothetical protein [Caulobacteraceae bacterium]